MSTTDYNCTSVQSTMYMYTSNIVFVPGRRQYKVIPNSTYYTMGISDKSFLHQHYIPTDDDPTDNRTPKTDNYATHVKVKVKVKVSERIKMLVRVGLTGMQQCYW